MSTASRCRVLLAVLCAAVGLQLPLPAQAGEHQLRLDLIQGWELPVDLDAPVVHGSSSVPLLEESDLFEDGLEQPRSSTEKGLLVALGRVGGLVAGGWAAALSHELGHAAVARAYGYRFAWPTTGAGMDLALPYWRATRPGPGGTRDNLREHSVQLRNVAMSGFLFSGAVSEALLAIDAFPKSDTFVGGFIGYDLLNAVMYVIQDLVSVSQGRNGVGDIRDIDQKGKGVPRAIVYAFLLSHSAITLARVLENPDFIKLQYWWNSARPR